MATDPNKSIEVLEKMNELSINPPKDVEEAKNKESPLEAVEDDLSKFTRDNFALLIKQSDWVQEIQNELRGRFGLSEKDGGLSANQLIALLTNESVNLNDRIAKLLMPTFQLMTARQQAETAAKQAELKNPNITINNGSAYSQSDMRNINENLPKEHAQEVLQGMTALGNLSKLLSKLDQPKQTEEPVEVKDTTPKD